MSLYFLTKCTKSQSAIKISLKTNISIVENGTVYCHTSDFVS